MDQDEGLLNAIQTNLRTVGTSNVYLCFGLTRNEFEQSFLPALEKEFGELEVSGISLLTIKVKVSTNV